jgi:hypothetical protein
VPVAAQVVAERPTSPGGRWKAATAIEDENVVRHQLAKLLGVCRVPHHHTSQSCNYDQCEDELGQPCEANSWLASRARGDRGSVCAAGSEHTRRFYPRKAELKAPPVPRSVHLRVGAVLCGTHSSAPVTARSVLAADQQRHLAPLKYQCTSRYPGRKTGKRRERRQHAHIYMPPNTYAAVCNEPSCYSGGEVYRSSR